MPAAVCGSKRSYFLEELDLPSPPLTKKLRCGSPSSSSPVYRSLLHVKSLLPQTDPQVAERVLQECGNGLDSAIHGVQEQWLESAEVAGVDLEQDDTLANDGHAAPVATDNAAAPSDLPADGAEWVDLFVREMTSATSFDDARARASRVLEVLEKSICSRAAEESAQRFQEENMALKEKIEALIRENVILKKAVAIQHERQKDFEYKSRELQHVKQLVSQYQDQIRTLQVNNYALTMHLRQAQQNSTMPGHFHPDVF